MKRETRPWDSPSQYYGKYNILERVLVDNIIPRKVIINRGVAEVDYHISRDDIFDLHPLKNVMFVLLYRTLLLYYLTMVWEFQKAT